MRINTPKKREIFTFVICCISFLSLFSFHSLILRFPPSGCFYLQSLPSFRFVRIARALYIYQLRILHYIYNMYARAVVTSMCKYIHAHTFVPLALLALACPGACFFVSCFFVLAGLSALPFADFHFLLGWAMATDSSGATCFRFPMNPFPVNLPLPSSSPDFSFSPSASLHSTPSIHLSLLPNHPLPEAFPASFIDTLQVCPAPSVAIPIHCLSFAVRPSQQDPPSSSAIAR